MVKAARLGVSLAGMALVMGACAASPSSTPVSTTGAVSTPSVSSSPKSAGTTGAVSTPSAPSSPTSSEVFVGKKSPPVVLKPGPAGKPASLADLAIVLQRMSSTHTQIYIEPSDTDQFTRSLVWDRTTRWFEDTTGHPITELKYFEPVGCEALGVLMGFDPPYEMQPAGEFGQVTAVSLFTNRNGPADMWAMEFPTSGAARSFMERIAGATGLCTTIRLVRYGRPDPPGKLSFSVFDLHRGQALRIQGVSESAGDYLSRRWYLMRNANIVIRVATTPGMPEVQSDDDRTLQALLKGVESGLDGLAR